MVRNTMEMISKKVLIIVKLILKNLLKMKNMSLTEDTIKKIHSVQKTKMLQNVKGEMYKEYIPFFTFMMKKFWETNGNQLIAKATQMIQCVLERETSSMNTM